MSMYDKNHYNIKKNNKNKKIKRCSVCKNKIIGKEWGRMQKGIEIVI